MTQHNGFLIVSGESDEGGAGNFEGLILRHQLYTLLVYKQWGERSTSGLMLTAEQFDTEVCLLHHHSDRILVLQQGVGQPWQPGWLSLGSPRFRGEVEG